MAAGWWVLVGPSLNLPLSGAMSQWWADQYNVCGRCNRNLNILIHLEHGRWDIWVAEEAMIKCSWSEGARRLRIRMFLSPELVSTIYPQRSISIELLATKVNVLGALVQWHCLFQSQNGYIAFEFYSTGIKEAFESILAHFDLNVQFLFEVLSISHFLNSCLHYTSLGTQFIDQDTAQ